MPPAHPMAEQCPATSKRTGQRCQQRVIGGGPCRMHGGNAPQVRAAREVRLLTAEAAREIPRTAAEAADVMTSAMNDAHSLLQRLKANIANGTLTAADLSAMGEWMDRAARLAKLVVDAGIEERRVVATEKYGSQIAGVLQAFAATAIRSLLEQLHDQTDAQALVERAWPQIVRTAAPAVLRAAAQEGQVD